MDPAHPSNDPPIQFQRIMLATDFTPASAKALPYAAAIARHFQSTLLVAYVIPSESYDHIPSGLRDDALFRMRREAEENIKALLATSHLEGVPHEAVLGSGDLWPALSTLAEDHLIDLLVTASHGRHGLDKLVSGSPAEEVARLAARPVLLVGPEVTVAPAAEVHVERILHATDFSPESRRAMDYAYALSKAYSAHLSLLHVVETAWTEPLSTRATPEAFWRARLLERGWPESEEGVEPEFLVESGSPERLIVETAHQRGVQLVVLSFPGASHPKLAAHLPGPLAYNVVTHARCPVLVVRGSGETSNGAAGKMPPATG